MGGDPSRRRRSAPTYYSKPRRHPHPVPNPRRPPTRYALLVRLVIATCSVDYAGRLSAHLPLAKRLLMLKSDGSVLVHSDGGSYKPLNWMSPPCTVTELEPDETQAEAGITAVWKVTQKKTDDVLIVSLYDIEHDSAHELGIDPGLVKDGVEAHLQAARRADRPARRRAHARSP